MLSLSVWWTSDKSQSRIDNTTCHELPLTHSHAVPWQSGKITFPGKAHHSPCGISSQKHATRMQFDPMLEVGPRCNASAGCAVGTTSVGTQHNPTLKAAFLNIRYCRPPSNRSATIPNTPSQVRLKTLLVPDSEDVKFTNIQMTLMQSQTSTRQHPATTQVATCLAG